MAAQNLLQGKKGLWRMCIGLEIHAQISSSSKLFSRALNPSLASPVNSCVNLYDVATPGTLPLLNVAAVDKALTAALAMNCRVNRTSFFERKHYYYHDLPLGFQITQNQCPIAEDGSLKTLVSRHLPAKKKSVYGGLTGHEDEIPDDYHIQLGIDRIQIEQDSGKSKYENGKVLVDLNRAGCGLLEIVLAPTLWYVVSNVF